MELSVFDLAKMMDASCVRTYSTKADVKTLCDAAVQYQIGQVSVMQCFIPFVQQILPAETRVKIVGNVSFPSGSDSTSVKVFQAQEMVAAKVGEIDMVMNIAKLLSGDYLDVADDVKAVKAVGQEIPLKVIIEMSYLNPDQVRKACEIGIDAGATFIKTGSGWAEKGTTLDDVKLIKSIVGDRIKVKASGGIRDLETMISMIKAGANRFGVNLQSAKSILDDCVSRGGKIAI